MFIHQSVILLLSVCRLIGHIFFNFISIHRASQFLSTFLSLSPCLVGRGLQRNNLNSVTTLGEIPRQYIPCPTHALQRQILCLTNLGVHILQKVRPIDYLYRFLSQDNFMESYCVRDFFALYGTVESACMCLAIACGLPGDAGGARHLDPTIIGQ